MERWIGKVAVVTGASAGIGSAIAIDLVKAGLTVVALARRADRVEELNKEIPPNCTGKLIAKKCDVRDEVEVKNIFDWIENELGGVDILINNAGLMRTANLVDKDNTEAIRQVIDTNVMGVVFCTRSAFHSMKDRNVAGHIVIINSLGGHRIPYTAGKLASFNMYQPSKYAITAMTEVLRQEFQAFKTNIKITSISPGLVKTDFPVDEMKPFVNSVNALMPEDVSQSVLYALGTPPRVQIHDLWIRPLGVGL